MERGDIIFHVRKKAWWSWGAWEQWALYLGQRWESASTSSADITHVTIYVGKDDDYKPSQDGLTEYKHVGMEANGLDMRSFYENDEFYIVRLKNKVLAKYLGDLALALHINSPQTKYSYLNCLKTLRSNPINVEQIKSLEQRFDTDGHIFPPNVKFMCAQFVADVLGIACDNLGLNLNQYLHPDLPAYPSPAKLFDSLTQNQHFQLYPKQTVRMHFKDLVADETSEKGYVIFSQAMAKLSVSENDKGQVVTEESTVVTETRLYPEVKEPESGKVDLEVEQTACSKTTPSPRNVC